MSDTLKDQAARFAEQHFGMYGDCIVPRQKNKEKVTGVTEEVTDGGEGVNDSWFAEQLRDINEEWTHADSLQTLEQMICNCRKCPLWESRDKFVFGVGNPDADVVVIGEAPGADENRQGEPFVGAAGKLLTKILAAINFEREDVYILNILKSRPPGNRTPEKAEIAECIPYLYKQIDLIRPKFILATGLTAAKALLGTTQRMKDLRGTIQDWHGIPMIVTYHPAALLRNPHWKRPTWEDVQLLRRLYDESKAEGDPSE